VAHLPSGAPFRKYLGNHLMVPADCPVSKKDVWVLDKLWKSRHYKKVPSHRSDPQPHVRMGLICIDDMQCNSRAWCD
jgi:hypothetical protein